jgi:hypothetical protein
MENIEADKTFLTCPQCKSPVDPAGIPDSSPVSCSYCNTLLEILIFPELRKRMENVQARKVSMPGAEASCFFHDDKVATHHCSQCGRFICDLCDLEIGSMHMCPLCVSTGKKRGKVKVLKHKAILYDKIAMALTLYPLLLLFTAYFTFMTAPAGLYLVIRYWNKQETVIPRSKARFIIAGILGFVEIAGWIVLIYFMVTKFPEFMKNLK